ncbi:MAG: hypothetical protein ACJZ10_03510 [Candidatus Neomarinimicrobiota bacterium]
MLSSFRKEFVQYNYDSMVNMLESSSKVTISAPEDFSPRIFAFQVFARGRFGVVI